MFFLGGKVSEALVRSERGVRSFFKIFILIDHRTNILNRAFVVPYEFRERVKC